MDTETLRNNIDLASLRRKDIRFGAVLWDMDGTLADSEPLHEKALRTTLSGLGITPSSDEFNHVIGKENTATFDYFAVKYHLSISYEEYRDAVYRHFCSHSRNVKPTFSLNIYLALDALGIPQAIVSNSDRMLVQATMQAIGIEKAGLTVVTRNDVLHGKPDPEGYLRAAYLLGVAPESVAVIEDSHVGAQAGIAAGMTVFGVPAPENRHRFHPSIPLANSAASLLKYLVSSG